MPGLESNLSVVLIIFAILAGIGWVCYHFRDPLFFTRAFRYFKTWWDRDKLAEAEAQRQKDARRQAEKEIRAACHEDEPVVTPQTITPSTDTTEGKCGPSETVSIAVSPPQQVVVQEKQR